MLLEGILYRNKKGFQEIENLLIIVGMKGFEPSTPGPPDQYSNRTELHPDFTKIKHYLKWLKANL